MAKITFQGNSVSTMGELPQLGVVAPKATLVNSSLQEVEIDSYSGKKVVLNIFPSLDTAVCATSVRKFNKMASDMPNTMILSISKDLPFAMERFCAIEGLKKVISLSGYRSHDFDQNYGLVIADGPLKGLYARAVIVISEEGKVVYEELVPEITQEPNYDEVLKLLTDSQFFF